LIINFGLDLKRPSQCGQALARPGVPQLHGLLRVATARHQQPFGRVPVDGAHVGAVAAHDALLVAAQKVPDAHRAVVAGRRELDVVGRKTVWMLVFLRFSVCEAQHARNGYFAGSGSDGKMQTLWLVVGHRK